VITSSSIHPEFGSTKRFSTTVLNGALLTVMEAYLDRLSRSVAKLGVPVTPSVIRAPAASCP